MSLGFLRGFLKRTGRFWSFPATGRMPVTRRRIVPRVEALEDRTLLTTTLYLDFGDRFAGMNWLVTDEASLTAAGVNGPDFANVASTDNLVFYSFAEAVEDANTGSGIDYNGDGSFTSADVTELRANVVRLVQRYFSPYWINVVELTGSQGAANMNDVAAKLASNDSFDAYVFVTGLIGSPSAISASLRGTSGSDPGLDYNQDTIDNTAVVLANHIFNRGYADATADTSLAYIIAHEAAHTFGMLHTENHPTADDGVRILTQSDMVAKYPDHFWSEGADHGRNLQMFSRFPLPTAADEQSILAPIPEIENPHNVLAAKGTIGADYITGTGAYDVITVNRVNANTANVSVAAYRNWNHSSRIGELFQYQVDTTDGLMIDAGFNDDRIVIDATLETTVTVRGMAGKDELIVNGNGVASGTYTPNARPNLTAEEGLDGNDSYGGTLTFGATTIVFSEFEPDSRVHVHSVGALTFKSPGGTDEVTIDSPEAGVSRISGKATLPVMPIFDFVPLTFSHVPTVTLDLANNDGNPRDDVVKIDGLGLAADDLATFTVLTGTGNDTLEGTSASSLPIAGSNVKLIFDGGAGSDMLKGRDANSTWEITGVNEGKLDVVTEFKNVENLTGNAAQDVFEFDVGGSVSGNIDGGQAFDTIDVSALNVTRSQKFVTFTGLSGEKGNIFSSPRPINGYFDNIDDFKWPPGVTLLETDNGTVVGEGGVGDTYKILLESAPTAPVNIRFTVPTGLTVASVVASASPMAAAALASASAASAVSLTFTPSDWNQERIVTVTANNGAFSASQIVSITHTAESTDARYNGITVAGVHVAVQDSTWPFALVAEHEQDNGNPMTLQKVPGTAGWLITGVLAPRDQWTNDHDRFKFIVDSNDSLGVLDFFPSDRAEYGWESQSHILWVAGSNQPTRYMFRVWVSKPVDIDYGPELNGSLDMMEFRYRTRATEPFEAALYQSQDELIDASDTLLSLQSFQAEDVGFAWQTGRFNLSTPLAFDFARPYVIVQIDPNDKIYDRADPRVKSSKLTLLPDVFISQATLNDARNAVEFGYGASVTLANGSLTQTVPMPRPFRAGLYRSDDDQFDPAEDTLIAKQLFDGTKSQGVFHLNQPLGVDAARPYLFVVGDPDNEINELSEENNRVEIFDIPPFVMVLPTGAGTEVTEGGGIDRYTVVLTQMVFSNVVIGINAGTQVRTSATRLTFTPQNWRTPQTVTVTAIDDKVAEGDQVASIKHAIIQGPFGFTTLPVAPVRTVIHDNDHAGARIVQSKGRTAVKEGGVTDTYAVRLSSQPRANVNVVVNKGSQLVATPKVMTFTPQNWSTPQTVTLKAVDDRNAEGTQVFTIAHTATSKDRTYHGLKLASVNATIVDNDRAVVQAARSSAAAAKVNILDTSTATFANVSLQANVILGTSIGSQVGLAARISADGMYYADLLRTETGVLARIGRRYQGKDVKLIEMLAGTDSGTLRFELQGDALRLFLNDTLLTTVIDAQMKTGKMGIIRSGASTVENFSASAL